MLANNRRWLIVLGGFLIMTFTMGIVYNTFDQFIVPVCADLGFTRGQYSVCKTLMFLAAFFGALAGPVLFRIFKTSTVQKVGIALMALAYCAVSFAKSIMVFYIVYVICGFTMSIVSTLPVSVIISQWYPDKANSATGIATVGSGVGGAIFSPIVNSIINNFGWRMAFIVSGILVAVISLGAGVLVFKENPSFQPAVQDPSQEKKKAKVVWSKPFILLCISYAIMCSAGCVSMSVLVPHLRDLEYSSDFAAMVASLSMVAMALGKFAYGFMMDKLGVRITVFLSAIAGITSTIGILFFFHPLCLILVFTCNFFLAPIGSAGLPALAGFFSADPDTRTSYAGVISAIGSLAGAANYLVIGTIYDATGSYNLMFWGSLALNILCVYLVKKMFDLKAN